MKDLVGRDRASEYAELAAHVAVPLKSQFRIGNGITVEAANAFIEAFIDDLLLAAVPIMVPLIATYLSVESRDDVRS
jgi:hypothetical protein